MDELRHAGKLITEDLFATYLNMDDKSRKFFKNFLRLDKRDYETLSFFTTEMKINPVKANTYKSLITKLPNDLNPVFLELKDAVPESFSNNLLKILQGDRTAIFEFINQFLVINKKTFKSWEKVDTKNRILFDKNFEFLNSIFSLMVADTKNTKAHYEAVLTRILKPKYMERNNPLRQSGLTNYAA